MERRKFNNITRKIIVLDITCRAYNKYEITE